MTVPVASGSSSVAAKTFELNNNVQTVDPDQVYHYDANAQREILKQRPWKTDPSYFKNVRIAATALIKMVMHARSGGQYEIMGLMQGKIDGDTFVVLDAFPLPVIGTETRVNAGAEADAFAVEYQTNSSSVGRNENIVGWYHSHPGYGCWLSGIDVMTQFTNQMFQDPFLAVVIDPNRTVSAGRVEIGAFRTYPESYTPPNAAPSEYQSVPLNKIEDFGAHANRYYPLEISHFKSSLDTKLLDLLWNKYWVMTLSQSPLVSNRAYTTSQIADLTHKLSQTETAIGSRASLTYLAPEVAAAKGAVASGSAVTAAKGKDKAVTAATTGGAEGAESKKEETALGKAIRDSNKVACECQHGLLSQLIKDTVFNLKAGSNEALLSAR